MANVVRIKRRASGAAGAPASLQNAELAYNEVDDTLYYGKGTGGAGGSATTVEAIGGKGAYVAKTGDQTIAGTKTFSSSPVVPAPSADGHAATKKYVDDGLAGLGAGDMLKATYDSNDNGKIDVAEAAESVPWEGVSGRPVAATTSVDGLMSAGDKTKLNGIASGANNYTHPSGDGNLHVPATGTGNDGKVLKAGDTAGSAAWGSVAWDEITDKPATFAPSAHEHEMEDIEGLAAALADKAPLVSPALTGSPTAPTATEGDASTKVANTAFVAAAIAALTNSAPGTLDTLAEIAAALGDDPDFAATITTALAGKLAKASNLSDLTDVAAARGNLGLLSMALQAASAVAITGGTIDGITLDGGTF